MVRRYWADDEAGQDVYKRQTGGNGRVRVVGVGVIAFLRRHPEYGRRMPVQFGIFRIQ